MKPSPIRKLIAVIIVSCFLADPATAYGWKVQYSARPAQTLYLEQALAVRLTQFLYIQIPSIKVRVLKIILGPAYSSFSYAALEPLLLILTISVLTQNPHLALAEIINLFDWEPFATDSYVNLARKALAGADANLRDGKFLEAEQIAKKVFAGDSSLSLMDWAEVRRHSGLLEKASFAPIEGVLGEATDLIDEAAQLKREWVFQVAALIQPETSPKNPVTAADQLESIYKKYTGRQRAGAAQYLVNAIRRELGSLNREVQNISLPYRVFLQEKIRYLLDFCFAFYFQRFTEYDPASVRIRLYLDEFKPLGFNTAQKLAASYFYHTIRARNASRLLAFLKDHPKAPAMLMRLRKDRLLNERAAAHYLFVLNAFCLGYTKDLAPLIEVILIRIFPLPSELVGVDADIEKIYPALKDEAQKGADALISWLHQKTGQAPHLQALDLKLVRPLYPNQERFFYWDGPFQLQVGRDERWTFWNQDGHWRMQAVGGQEPIQVESGIQIGTNRTHLKISFLPGHRLAISTTLGSEETSDQAQVTFFLNTGQSFDPDIFERNITFLRNAEVWAMRNQLSVNKRKVITRRDPVKFLVSPEGRLLEAYRLEDRVPFETGDQIVVVYWIKRDKLKPDRAIVKWIEETIEGDEYKREEVPIVRDWLYKEVDSALIQVFNDPGAPRGIAQGHPWTRDYQQARREGRHAEADRMAHIEIPLKESWHYFFEDLRRHLQDPAWVEKLHKDPAGVSHKFIRTGIKRQFDDHRFVLHDQDAEPKEATLRELEILVQAFHVWAAPLQSFLHWYGRGEITFPDETTLSDFVYQLLFSMTAQHSKFNRAGGLLAVGSRAPRFFARTLEAKRAWRWIRRRVREHSGEQSPKTLDELHTKFPELSIGYLGKLLQRGGLDPKGRVGVKKSAVREFEEWAAQWKRDHPRKRAPGPLHLLKPLDLSDSHKSRILEQLRIAPHDNKGRPTRLGRAA